METSNKSRWSYGQFEKIVLPGWLFHPGYEELRRIAFIAYSTVFIAVFTLIIIGSLRLIRHDTVRGLIDLSFALVMAGIIVYHRKTKRYDDDLALYMGITTFGIFCICLFFFSGFDRGDYLWSYTFPLIVFPLVSTRRGIIAMILFLIPISLLLVIDPSVSLITSYPQGFAFSYIASILVVSGMSYLYERNREKNGQQLNMANAALLNSNEEMEQQIEKRTAELARSEGNYRFLTERMSDIIWTTDLNLTVTYVSPSVTRILGFAPEEYRRLPFHERLTPESCDKAMAVFASEIEQEKMLATDPERNLQIELEFCHKDGSVVWMESLMNAIRDDKGNMVGIHGVSRDITKRMAAEREMKLSEDRFRDLFENSTDFICTHDLKGNLLSVNSTAVESLGYTADEVIGMNIRASLSPKYQLQFDEYLKQIEEKGVANGMLAVRTREGVKKILEYSNTLRTEGVDEPLVRGIARDVTEQWKTRKALKESAEKYRTILENIEEGYHEVNLAGSFTFVNDSFLRITGYSREELMGMNYKQFGVDEENARKIFQAYNRVYRTGEPSTRIEWDITRKDGVRRSHETSASLIKDSSGNPQGFRGIVTDITDRKHAEEEKRSLQERLQRAEKMEALGTMAGGVAHDLNNVLGIVVGYAEMLLMDADKSSSIRPGLVNIMNGGQRAAAIVQDLLTLARRGVHTRVIFNLNTIINDFQESIEFEKLRSFHPGVQIKTDLKADLLNIKGSPVHLSKTFFNLVSNAAEAMTDGGILTIKTANEYLDKPIQGYDEVREGDYVVLSVSDTGDGIQAADLKRIFEPFYTKKVMGRSGTGLGLAVVWGTVKDHNGYINVQSEEGKGSTFTLYFPVTREDISAERIAVDIAEYVGKGESILIVDDVEGQRELAFQMLKKLNYIVATVSSGEEALEYLKTQKADLIILDMIMDPGMDGLDTYRGILEIHPQQKAIIVSGFSETDRVQDAQALGAGSYVRKPYVIEKLGLAVRNELGRIT